jgi:hypothetical protein
MVSPLDHVPEILQFGCRRLRSDRHHNCPHPSGILRSANLWVQAKCCHNRERQSSTSCDTKYTKYASIFMKHGVGMPMAHYAYPVISTKKVCVPDTNGVPDNSIIVQSPAVRNADTTAAADPAAEGTSCTWLAPAVNKAAISARPVPTQARCSVVDSRQSPSSKMMLRPLALLPAA